MKKTFLSTALLLLIAACAQVHAQTIADWTFETTEPTTAGPVTADVGTGTALGLHASGSAAYSSPTGNGSYSAWSSNNWSVGDYYQFEVSTLNYSNISLSFDQTSSNTGPGSFQLEYSTNGSTFTNIGSAYTVLANASPNTTWTNATYNSAYTLTPNVSSVSSALSNDATLYFRLVDAGTVSANGGAIGTSGTDRVDNVDITGVAATPEPSAWALGALGIAAFAFLRRRWVGMQNS